MKKIKFLLLVCLLGILSTGCVKFNANMNIKKDKSMDFTIIYALDKSVFGDQASIKESDLEEVKKSGFTVSKYSDGNMEGFTMTKKINNIDEVSTETDAEYNLSGLMAEGESKYLFKVVKGTNKNTYYAKFKFDANDSGLNMNEGEDEKLELPDETEDNDGALLDETNENPFEGMDLSKLTANMDLSFNVTLPNSAISNNATSTEDNNKKLTWKLSSTNAQAIEFAFELDNNGGSNDMILYIGIGVIALLVIVVIVLMLSKKKGNTENVTPVVNNTETPNPVTQPTVEENNEVSNNQ